MTVIKGYEGLADYNRAGNGIRTQHIWEPKAMKVDDPRSVSSQSVTPASEAAQGGDRKVKPLSLTGNDAVRLSSDLQLVDVAVRAAALAGDVRPEAVARARALLDSGRLGEDSLRLADRLIDSLTEPSSD